MSQQEYTIHIFGQDITSQDGLFRLDEIRRVGIQIGKVEDTESTQYKRFAQTKVGKLLRNRQKIRLIRMGELGSTVLADPAATVEFGRWLAVVRYVASETIGVLPDRFKSIDGDNPEVEMSEDNSEWEDF